MPSVAAKGGKRAASKAPQAEVASGKKGKGKRAREEGEEEDDEKDLEVKESLWLGKALRRQRVQEEAEEAKAAKIKPKAPVKPADDDELSDSSEDEEPEKLGGGFAFDADDSAVDSIVQGWKFKGMGGAAHRPDYAGRLTAMQEKISKRIKQGAAADGSDEDEVDDDEGDGDGGDGGSGEESSGEDDEDSAHESDGEEDAHGARPGEDDEDEEDDDDEEDEDEGEDEEKGGGEKGGKGAAKRAAAASAAEQERREREAEFFDDAPVPAAQAEGTFASLHLSRPFLKATTAMGFTSPTAIQGMVVPVALQGKDICASSRTGSGKTAAFSLPFLERLLHRPKRVACTRVLVLTPTRELAVQCHAMIESLAQFTDIRCCIVIGGVKNQVQEMELRKKPDVVVATPGRMLDHLRNAAGVNVDGLEILVLDEADRLLEMGFTEEVEELVKMCPVRRQTMLFSATMTHDVDRLAAYSLKRPVRVTADSSIRVDGEGELNKVAVPTTLNQEFIRIRKEHESDREAILLCLCTRSFHTKTIIFCREKRRAHRLRIIFGLAGLKVDELHGNLTQAQRLESLESFKAGESDFLVATDLAGRGLDVTGIDVVINFEVPRNVSEYVHRVGRTARAGRKGRAVTLADDTGRTKKMLKEIVRSAPDVVKRRVVPPEAVQEWKERIEGMQEDIDGIAEEEKVEKELRMADMEQEKAKNLIDHQDDIMNRPKKTWFQTKQEKREAREQNPSSGRVIDNKDNIHPETGERLVTKKKVLGTGKKDKYAGMSRKKRRNAQFREEEDEDRKQMERERQANDMFEGEGPRMKAPKKPLSQKAAKAAVRRGEIDPEQKRMDAKKRRSDVKRKRRAEEAAEQQPKKRARDDKELFQEAVDEALASGGRKRGPTKNNKRAKATNKSFKSKKRMKRRG